MTNHINLEYLCTNMGNLSAIPIRLYENEKKIYYYSIISLPVDPFLSYKNEVCAINDHIGYFITPHGYYYGVVNFNKYRIVIGPTRQTQISNQELREIAFELNVPRLHIDEFIHGMKNIVQMPLMSVIQMMCMVNHVLNNGEMLSLSDIAIVDLDQQNLIENLKIEDANRILNDTDVITNPSYLHNSMDIEKRMMNSIQRGDLDDLNDLFTHMPAMRFGILAQDELRQSKNILITAATLISRAVIHEGMDLEEALSLSDNYIQKCELLKDIDSITNLTYRLVMDYAERMQKLHYGNNVSKLVIDINKYIRQHLSEPITVEAIARFLNRGRSRLSTDFKKITGENLSDYILKQKIDESKKLLRYTNKPAIDIAIYLGFSSQSHFSRTFKKYTDITPNEYRSSISFIPK